MLTKSEIKQALLNWKIDHQIGSQDPSWYGDVTFIVSTFERPQCLYNLLTSIRRYYLTIPILVCDSSHEPLFQNEQVLPQNITWHTLPYEQGHTLGASRNHLVQQVHSPYFFLCDDDHVLNRDTDLARMYQFLTRHRYDIVGGCQGKGDYGTAIFEQVDDIVYQHFYRHHGFIEPGIVRCDRVSNTFLARTEAVQQVLWEDRVYGAEHAEFFLRATRAGLKIAQMNRVYVDHRRDCETATGLVGHLLGWILPHRDRLYHHLRGGKDELLNEDAQTLERKYCWEKNGLKEIVTVPHRRERKKFERLMNTVL